MSSLVTHRRRQYWTPELRADLKARLLSHILGLAERGIYPTLFDLADDVFPGEPSGEILRTLRNELIAEGLYRLPRFRATLTGVCRGLDGSTPESRAEIEARREEVLARKIARGETPANPPARLHRIHAPSRVEARTRWLRLA